ncbi:DNA repair protein RadC [Geminicoccaceae bacterium 1502E]|nr:DNA repair protein RadC [Geminicoccaceae bacterium 1502E]
MTAEAGPDGPRLLVTGETFRWKEQIKRAGGRWDAAGQRWVLSSAGQLAVLAAALDAPPGLAEAPQAYTAQAGTKHYHGHRERLRQRFLEALPAAPESLPDYELLELLLFFSVYRRDTKPAAKELLSIFGSLGGVLAAEPARYGESAELVRPQCTDEERRASYARDLRFTQILLKAIQEVAVRLAREEIKERPVIGSWSALIDYLHTVLAHAPSEQFRILFLDRKNILIRDEVQSRGTVDHTPLYPREVVKRALELSASAIIMVHNHPSGDPTPSQADIDMTRQVVQALAPVNVTVHDHVVMGKNRHVSFRSQGLF